MWYSNLYRRHLLDMHIDDWDDIFLSEFSPEVYVENLKKAKINYAMIYLQSHAGLCYFPTKVGTMHKAFEKEPDKMKRLIDLCHENDIRVCGYYSLFYNTREHDNHPEWRHITSSGKSWREEKFNEVDLNFSSASSARYGIICPNNPDQQKFVCDQIDEMLDYFTLDALFFDMPFWNGTCFCNHCQEEYKKMFGTPIKSLSTLNYAQLNDEEKEIFIERVEYATITMGGIITKFKDHIKNRCPELPIEFNFASSIASPSIYGCGETVARCCDYVGGDLYGDMYKHSFASKYFKNISINQPFEQMFSRCKPSLGTHTLTKTLDEMKASISSTMAHHGATLVIDAIDPVGTMDSRVYDRIGKALEFQMPYEKYFTGEMVEDIGIYLGLRSKLTTAQANTSDCCRVLSSNLIRLNVPHGIVNTFTDFSKYKYIITPVLGKTEPTENIISYVENGGTLFISGMLNQELIEKLTGHKFVKMTEEKNIYITPKKEFEDIFEGFNQKYPLPYDGYAPIITPGKDAKIIATLTLPFTKPTDIRFASIHSNPPMINLDTPMVTISNYGKGKVIWSAVAFEGKTVWRGDNAGENYTEYTQVLLNLLNYASPKEFSFTSDAPTNVEITMFENEDSYTVNTYLMTNEPKIFDITPFTISVKSDKAPKSVTLLPEKSPVEYTYENGKITFKTRTLHFFDMYEIKF